MSLGPLAEYIALIQRTYGPAKPMRMQCGGCGSGIDVWPPDEGEKRSVTCPACGWTATLATGAAELSYHFNTSRYLCGTDDYPGGTPKRLVAGLG